MAAVRDRSTRAGTPAVKRKAKPRAASNDAASKLTPRPRKLAPAPPVTDCAKCQKLKSLQSKNTRLHREVERLVGMDRARVEQALAGGPVCLSDTEINEVMQRVYTPAFEQVVRVPVDIALSASAEDGDRLKAAQMVTDRVAGKVKDRVEHSGPNGAPLCTPTILEVIVVGSAP